MADYIIRNGELMHWGVPGMKWGIRRYQNKDGTLTPAGKKRYDKEMEKLKAEQKIIKNKERTQAKIDKLNALKKDNQERKEKLEGPSVADKVKAIKEAKATKKAHNDKTESAIKKRNIKDLSNDELQAKVDRLQLEKRYRDLMKEKNPPKSNQGADFVKNVLKRTGEDLAPQVTKHYAAKLINSLIGDTDDSGKPVERVFANNKKKA